MTPSLGSYLGRPRPKTSARDVAAELRAQVRRLEIRARQAMESGLAGLYQSAFRGLGLETGLETLARVKAQTGLPVLTDVHVPDQVSAVAAVVDVLQVPAFLCRQTDLLIACGETGLPVNVKKGQFLAAEDMGNIVDKITSTGNNRATLTERGSSFGYHNLVVDMRGLPVMRRFAPVIFDELFASKGWKWNDE